MNDAFELRRRPDDPLASVAVDAASVPHHLIDFKLQTLADVRRARLEVGVEEYTAVAVALTSEPQRKLEILVVLRGLQVAVFFRNGLAVNRTIFDHPLFVSDLDPPAQVLAIEQLHPLLVGQLGSRLLRHHRGTDQQHGKHQTHYGSPWKNKVLLYADLELDGAGDALAVVFDLGHFGPLHHNAHQRLGARKPHQDAAGRAQRLFTGADLVPNREQLGERFLLAHPNIIKALRVDAKVADQFVQAGARPARNFEDAKRRQHAVAGGCIFPENDVARLLAAERRPHLDHLLEDVLIADRRAQHADAVARQGLLQAQIGHDRGYHDVTGQVSRSLQSARRHQQASVAIRNSSDRRTEN